MDSRLVWLLEEKTGNKQQFLKQSSKTLRSCDPKSRVVKSVKANCSLGPKWMPYVDYEVAPHP